MSTIKSSDEHLTLNADGALKDIKFQANGVEKASISSAGAFTSTTIDATALTGDLPAISGASLTNLPSATADGFFATSGLSSKDLGQGLHIKTGDSGLGSVNSNFSQLIVEGNTTAGISILTSPTHEGVLAFSDSGGHRGLVRYSHSTDSLSLATADVDRLQITSDGRGLSQFTAKAWVVWTGGGTSINDSHNVSSITYLSTGVYEINYSNSLAGTDRYAINVTPSDKSGYWNNGIASIVDGESNASKTRILTMRSTTGGTENVDNIYAIVFGDN